MKTKTIDERLREKARKKLKEDLDKATIDFIRAINASGTMYRVNVSTSQDRGKDAETVEIFDTEVIKQIAAAAFDRMAPRREEEEINRFMKQIDGFQEQLNQMYDDIYDE